MKNPIILIQGQIQLSPDPGCPQGWSDVTKKNLFFQ